MTGADRKRLLQTLLLGTLLTALVMSAAGAGVLNALERWLYDQRVRRCQFFNPPPTDRLTHVDIDDGALRAIGSWPWPRIRWAHIIDELHAAGARAIALDVIFPEPQLPRVDAMPDGTVSPPINDDDAFAAALGRAGNVLVPVALTIKTERAPAPITDALRELFTRDLAMTMDQALAALNAHGHTIDERKVNFEAAYLGARRLAMGDRIHRELDAGAKTPEEVQQRIFGGPGQALLTPLTHALAEEYQRVRSREALLKFTLPANNLTIGVLGTEDLYPVPPLAEAAGITGFVDYISDKDGVVRSVPLLAEHQGRLWPQFGLALTCLYNGVDIRRLRIEGDNLIVPRPHGELRVPVTGHSIAPIPWFGGRDWQLMYTPPDDWRPHKHVPMAIVWEATDLLARIRANNAEIDEAIRSLYELTDPALLEAYLAKHPDLDDPRARQPIIENLLADPFVSGTAEALSQPGGPPLGEREQRFMAGLRAGRADLDISKQLASDLDARRKMLRDELNGQAVIVGFTATAAANADLVTTSLHTAVKCPGAMVHGVIFNALTTGVVWDVAPEWTKWLACVVLGLITSVAVGWLAPIRASAAAAAIATAWLVFNGVYLFDFHNWVVAAAAPLMCVIVPATGCMVWRYLDERVERARITRRFRSYVDTALVDYILEHPQEAAFAGRMRQTSIVFTDLAGFTTLVEKMGPGIASLISEYRASAVPVIREHGGCISGFMGDGIMFFFGAPRSDDDHAFNAVATVMHMQQALSEFNKQLATRGLPSLTTRAGITSGEVIAGDVGPPEASDYNVVGDIVNLASRLETANKATGTLTMLSDKTAAALNGRFLLRPVGRLRVVGKTLGVMVYEPLAYTDQATDQDRSLATLSEHMVDTYIAGDFNACLTAIDALEAAHGASKLAGLYRSACKHYLVDTITNFDGTIVLTEK